VIIPESGNSLLSSAVCAVTAKLIANAATKTMIRFFTDACDRVELRHAATIMPAMVGPKDAIMPAAVPFRIVAVASQISQENANAITKNHITGCLLIANEMLFCLLTPFRELFDSVIALSPFIKKPLA
jgi:hypothetical protein